MPIETDLSQLIEVRNRLSTEIDVILNDCTRRYGVSNIEELIEQYYKLVLQKTQLTQELDEKISQCDAKVDSIMREANDNGLL